MKKAIITAICSLSLFAAPLVASAQLVNTSSSVQQSFLSELQSLQQELSALTATINAMIVAAGGSVPAASTDSTNITSKNTALPNIKTTLLPPADLYGEMLTNSLLQAITPASSTDSFVSSSNETATSTNSNVAPVQNFATQLDPSCIAGLWGNGAQCGGLYYCTAGTAGGYWSSTACHLSE